MVPTEYGILNGLVYGVFGAVVGVVLFLLMLACILRRKSPFPQVKRHPQEDTYTDPSTGKTHEFPTIFQKPEVELSVVVPAYFEEDRLTPMMEECLKVLEAKQKADAQFTYEIIIVNDGSTDKTAQIGLKYSERYGCDKVRVMDLRKNRGKGGAVRLGVLSSRGKCILFADADGATEFQDIEKLTVELKNAMTRASYKGPVEDFSAVVCGSRAHLEEVAIATRSLFRTILMRGFHLLVYIFTVKGIRDTQCGFKLLTRKAAKICFQNLHIERWAFDVELLYIAETLKIPISEVAVTWTEIEGSKIIPVWSWLQMGRDLFMIWFHYFIGAWKIQN